MNKRSSRVRKAQRAATRTATFGGEHVRMTDGMLWASMALVAIVVAALVIVTLTWAAGGRPDL
jgi:hypothetical protein